MIGIISCCAGSPALGMASWSFNRPPWPLSSGVHPSQQAAQSLYIYQLERVAVFAKMGYM